MSEANQAHECDLFLFTSHHPYYADNALKEFAFRGSSNIDGWGIGSYNGGRANVLRSADWALRTGRAVSQEFGIAVQAVCSPVILGHLRLTSRGARRVENNHPFILNFLDYDWTFIHNGTAMKYRELVPRGEHLLFNSDNDSARVFEFMRKKLINYYLSDYKKSLIEGCRQAYQDLLEKDPAGKYNIILSNGYISFVFIHHRPFYFLRREKSTGETALLSTLRLTDHEEWVEFDKRPNKKAKMLVLSGPNLLMNGDVPK